MSPTAPTQTALTITLPNSNALASPQITDNGAAIYTATSSNVADLALQSSDDGALSIQSVTRTAKGPHQFDYGLSDQIAPILNEDGSVTLRTVKSGADSGQAVVGQIAQPWSVDAAGKAQPTHYEVMGHTLRQVVTPASDAQYPIISDPRVTLGTAVYFYGYGYEWRALGAAAASIAAAGGIVGCTAAKLPVGWARPIKVACATLGAPNLNKMIRFVEAVIGNPAYKTASCYEITWPERSTSPKLVNSSNCSG